MSNEDFGIKLCSNTISLGKGKTFEEIIQKVASQNGMMTKNCFKRRKKTKLILVDNLKLKVNSLMNLKF